MKNFTLLFLTLFVATSISVAQVNPPSTQLDAPTVDIFLNYTFSGTVIDANAYADGLLIIGNDGTNDVVIDSINTGNWGVKESLYNGLTSKLSAWAGDDVAFYYGFNSADSNVDTTDLRVMNSGVPSYLLDYGHEADTALTNVVRMDYGSTTGTLYYYLSVDGANIDPISGYSVKILETDGTDLNTFEVTQEVGFGEMVYPSNQNMAGKLESVIFNGKTHLLAGMQGSLGSYSAIITINYDVAGSTATLLYQHDNESYDLGNMVATSQYIYVTEKGYGTSETTPMIAVDANGLQYVVGTNNQFANDKPVVYGDSVFAINEQNGSGIRKLTVINGPTNINIININPVGETDAVTNMVVSGNKLYFLATPTGGSLSLYVIRLDISNAEPYLIKGLSGYSVAGMVSLGNGNLAYALETDSPDFGAYVHVTEGFWYAGYEVHNGTTFAWANDIVGLYANGEDLYILDHSQSGTDIQIWKHTLDVSRYKSADTRFYVKDIVDSTIIAGADVVIDNGLYTYSGVTNISGYTDFMGIVGGAWYDCTVTANGYKLSYFHEWIKEDAQVIELYLEEDAGTGINDKEAGNISMYPNPVKDVLYMNSSVPVNRVDIHNISGSIIKSVTGADIIRMDVSDLPNGIYIVRSTNIDGAVTTTKVTKR